MTREDVAGDTETDDGRAYLATDEIGREGVEAMCEPLLRGTRGLSQRGPGETTATVIRPYVPGTDASMTIDAGLQHDVQELFKHAVVPDGGGEHIPATLDMHGAAVVLDVATGQVLAMASNPGFDLDRLDEQYPSLLSDTLDAPLRNRATVDELRAGVDGQADDRSGRNHRQRDHPDAGHRVHRVFVPVRRLTPAAEWPVLDRQRIQAMADRPQPGRRPPPDPGAACRQIRQPRRLAVLLRRNRAELQHLFRDSGPTALGRDGVVKWYSNFGFGRKTGIGILESAGRRPDQFRELAGTASDDDLLRRYRAGPRLGDAAAGVQRGGRRSPAAGSGFAPRWSCRTR